MVDVDGSNFVQLTRDDGFQADPAYSPDGSMIVLSHSAAGDDAPDFAPRLADMPAEGGKPRPLLEDADSGTDFEPVYSPDGTKITFTREVEREGQQLTAVFVVAATGGRPRAVTTFAMGIEHPRWSPDGSKIIYNIERSEIGLDEPDNGIWTVPAEGGEPNQLLPTDERLHYFKPNYSPDGRWLLVGCAHRDTPNEDLCIAGADGSDPHPIVETDQWENHGAW